MGKVEWGIDALLHAGMSGGRRMIQTRHGEAIPLWMIENEDGLIEVVLEIE
jgi:hypothetical protein